MKKLIAFMLSLIFVLGFIGCNAPKSNTYIVIEASPSYLLVAAVGEDGTAIESQQYSVPNAFHPSHNVSVGDQIKIRHSDEVLESFPMQFAKIYSMGYYDPQAGHDVTVTLD